ncbi:MAG: MarR family EPS-associated transcriptional regulator [Thiocapsa sp.]|uniref:MarR family EPS-associated transcriptional regulator n=1 Tax=Thiocapsa sp. TaxID=2024551 RepID=UPI001BCFF3CC|nr:MarR family EPS-associated transcriptional regulator [Thiocapsa sp.]QVL50138.1 MAG: MarR family EPS-associated transcriptional regulator [Thiocapsa sp.]
MTDDLHYRVLKQLEAHPDGTQRDLAKALGISLGSTNFCMRAIIDQGWVKVQNFRRSDNKRAYAYLLTPQGIEAKARITARFLQRKRAEYEALKVEIAQLAAEAASHGQTNDATSKT